MTQLFTSAGEADVLAATGRCSDGFDSIAVGRGGRIDRVRIVGYTGEGDFIPGAGDDFHS